MISNFSFYYVSFLSFIEKIMRFSHFPKFAKLVFYKVKRNYVLKILKNVHQNVLEKYSISSPSHELNCDNNIIWVCWLQGEKNAPDLVKRCIDNLRKYNSSEYKLIVIDMNNFQEYTSISELIMKRYHEGVITNTHFSDILRFNLLMRHGGIWIDATYLTLKKLPSVIRERVFFTLASNVYDDKFIPMGRWSGNFMKFSKNNIVPSMMCELFDEYWTHNSKIIDYFLIDFYLSLIYDNFISFREEVDNNVKLGDNCFLMSNFLFDDFNDEKNGEVIRDQVQIYKLSYKNSPEKLCKENTFYKKYIELN